jgi:hypothetical protein
MGTAASGRWARPVVYLDVHSRLRPCDRRTRICVTCVMVAVLGYDLVENLLLAEIVLGETDHAVDGHRVG